MSGLVMGEVGSGSGGAVTSCKDAGREGTLGTLRERLGYARDCLEYAKGTFGNAIKG